MDEEMDREARKEAAVAAMLCELALLPCLLEYSDRDCPWW